jgi:hypothetical protein
VSVQHTLVQRVGHQFELHAVALAPAQDLPAAEFDQRREVQRAQAGLDEREARRPPAVGRFGGEVVVEVVEVVGGRGM